MGLTGYLHESVSFKLFFVTIFMNCDNISFYSNFKSIIKTRLSTCTYAHIHDYILYVYVGYAEKLLDLHVFQKTKYVSCMHRGRRNT